MKKSSFKRGKPWQDRHEVTRKAKLATSRMIGTMKGSLGSSRSYREKIIKDAAYVDFTRPYREK